MQYEFVYGGVRETDNALDSDGRYSTLAGEFPSIQAANTSADLIILGWGLWHDLNASTSFERLKKHLRLIDSRFNAPRVMWLATDARHSHHFKLQNNDRLIAFNLEMERRLRRLVTQQHRRSGRWADHLLTTSFYEFTLFQRYSAPRPLLSVTQSSKSICTVS